MKKTPKKIVDNWVHIPGHHCGSVAIQDVMTFGGHEYSEALCFGLGSGLGFFYTVSDQISPTRMIFPRGPGLEVNFFSLLDKPISWSYEEDPQKALEMAQKSIEQNTPVVVQTDIFYLDYYNSSTHFPGHVLVMWGFDDEKETVFLSDTAFDGLMEVSYENFKKARSSQSEPYPLKINWLELSLPDTLEPLEHLIPRAIRQNAAMMLEGAPSPRGTSSVDQIKNWAADMPDWTSAEDWSWCARFGYQVITKRGVDGAAFRWIYRDFLSEMEKLLPHKRALNLAQRMDEIGGKWAEASSLLKDLSELEKPSPVLVGQISRLAYGLWEKEKRFYTLALENF